MIKDNQGAVYMSRPGVTYQEVAAAASQLMSQGRNPTIEQIRLILGTGSSTTIANHLKHWKEQQNGSSLLAVRENVPEELVGLLQGLWQRVIDHSEEKMAVVEAGLQHQLREYEQKLEKYKHSNSRWQQLFNQWTKEKENLVKINNVLNESVQALENTKFAMQSQLDGQRQQLQEKQDRINELFRLHKLAQANLEYDRETAKQERMEEHRLLNQQLENALKLNKQLEEEKWQILKEKAQLEGKLKAKEILTEKGLVFE